MDSEFRSSPSTQKFEQKGVSVQYPKITSIFDFSAEALGQLSLWWEQNPPAFPISSIIGFSQFTANLASVDTAESTNSNGFTNLATVGPSLSGLSDGKYVILYGAAAYTDTVGAGFAAVLSFQVNSLSYGDVEECISPVGDYTSTMRAITKTLSGGNNTLTMKYRATGGPAQNAFFKHRFLIALRYSNV